MAIEMIFGKFLGQPVRTGAALIEMDPAEARAQVERLESAFFEVSSVFLARKDMNAVLEHLVRESHKCLRANRSTLFLYDPKSDVLRSQLIHAPEPRYQQVGMVEEKEIGKRALRQGKPLLLAGPESFSDFFKYEERENKITSLMSVPQFSKGKPMGVLSAARINGKRGFDGRSLKLFSSFSNLACAAAEIGELREAVQKMNDVQGVYERHLDNILAQLEGLSGREQQRINIHLEAIREQQSSDSREASSNGKDGSVPWAEGKILVTDETGADRRKDERIDLMVRVEFDEEYCSFTKNVSKGGAFVVTPNPMDLGDEFILKLHIPDGKAPFDAPCKVVWSNKYGKDSMGLRRGMGVKFTGLQPDEKDRLGEYIQTFTNTPG